MNLTEDKKEPLRGRTLIQKRIMVEMQYKGAAQPKGKTDSPQDFIHELYSNELRQEKRVQLLTSLKVALTSNPVSWVQDFGNNGLNAILKNLIYCCDK